MNARHRVLLPACAALLATVVAHPGLAAERVCSRLTIATDAGFRDRFGALAEHIAGELSARSDIESSLRRCWAPADRVLTQRGGTLHTKSAG
jgi:hypothetical protein